MRPDAADHEAFLSRYLQGYAEWPGSQLSFVRRNLGETVRALAALRKLPALTATPSMSPQGVAIRTAMLPHSTFLRTWMPILAVLPLPECPSEVGLGARNQTLRRKVRSAERLGISCSVVPDGPERERLLAVASESEREHPNELYRRVNPDNTELTNFPLWIAAYSADERALLLAVAAVDGEWAWLRYFRTIGTGPEQSDARYLALYALCQQLTSAGVRYLFDQAGMTRGLTAGLRHYQRMVGFRAYRVRLRKPLRRGQTREQLVATSAPRRGATAS
jgi:hypothetical protein